MPKSFVMLFLIPKQQAYDLFVLELLWIRNALYFSPHRPRMETPFFLALIAAAGDGGGGGLGIECKRTTVEGTGRLTKTPESLVTKPH